MCFIVTLFVLLAGLLEIKLLGMFAQSAGAGNMWLWLLASLWIGFTLMREQREMSAKLQMRLARGEIKDPSELLRPLINTLSGFLLIAPGLITDLIGLALLYPPCARWALIQLSRRGLNAAARAGGDEAR